MFWFTSLNRIPLGSNSRNQGLCKWLENLSKNFRVVIFDKRGQGMSDEMLQLVLKQGPI